MFIPFLIPIVSGLLLGWVMAYALPIRRLWAIVLTGLLVPVVLILLASLFIYYFRPPAGFDSPLWHPSQPFAAILGTVSGYGILGLTTFGYAFHRTRRVLMWRERQAMEEGD